MSVAELRNNLAKQNNAEFTCALTTGIFLRIVAKRAYELYSNHPELAITPFWRVIEADSTLAKKLSFDPEFITEMRRAEGIN